MPTLEIYKRTQGRYTRLATLVSAVVIGSIGAVRLGTWLFSKTDSRAVEYGVSVLLILGIGVLMAWIVNRPSTADFLIATEGEMKKVSWASRKEIIGSTKVVIVTTLILTALMFGVDLIFITLFSLLGVMRVTG